MVNEEKVKLMNKMALYEEKYGKEDFKIASYYKKDYVSYQTIFTVIWARLVMWFCLEYLRRHLWRPF